MLDKRLLKMLTLDELAQYRIERKDWLKLTEERLKRLKEKQSKDSEWKAYDKYADNFVGIDIRIEEQTAVLEELLQDIEILDNRTIEISKEQRKATEIQIPMELGI